MAKRILKKQIKYVLFAIPVIAVIILSILLIIDAKRDEVERVKNENFMLVAMAEIGDLKSYVLPIKGIYVPPAFLIVNGDFNQYSEISIMNLLGKNANFTIKIESENQLPYKIYYYPFPFELLKNDTQSFRIKIVPDANRAKEFTVNRTNYTVTVYADDEIYRIGKFVLMDIKY